MNTKKQMMYRMKAKGQYVQKYNDNIKEIKLKRLTENEIVFSICGIKTKREDIAIDLSLVKS